MDRIEIGLETIAKAKRGGNPIIDSMIIAAFMDKGIPANEITPRENVFTYNAWQALGRQVRKGEKGVKTPTIKSGIKQDTNTGETKAFKVFASATVFHISQTDPIN